MYKQVLAAALLLLPSLAAVAQQDDFPPEEHDVTASDGQAGETASPLALSLGLQEDNSLGLVLKGEDLLTSERAWFDRGNVDHVSLSGFVSYLADASWSSKDESLNNASFSLRPTLALNVVRAGGGPDRPPSLDPHGYPYLFLDIRQRYGEFEEAEGEIRDVNQTILGIGVGYRFRIFDALFARAANVTGERVDEPRLEVTWHTVEDSSEESASLPDGLTADEVRLRLTSTFPLYPLCRPANDGMSCPFNAFFDISGGRPTTGDDRDWQVFYNLGIKYESGDGKLSPIIHFKAGDEHGLQFDKQLLLGAVLNLAGLGS